MSLMFLFCYSSDGETVEVDAELVIGADGAHSAIRNEMMKKPRYLQVKTPLYNFLMSRKDSSSESQLQIVVLGGRQNV